MIRFFKVAAFFIALLFIITSRVYAESSYVLPYPSSMPGTLGYKFHLVYEAISRYWYFGEFGQFDYSLKMADKYLIEAKTLFEYKQYLLGHNSLQKSDLYFSKILPNVTKAENGNRDISQKRIILKNAVLKHIETLEKLEKDTPEIFNWQPEKALSTTLYLKEAIVKSIVVRNNSL